MMKDIREFNYCVYCFSKKENIDGSCPHCGYEAEYLGLPGWWLPPGTVLKGNYMVGKPLDEKEDELHYLGWDIERKLLLEIVEYFPKQWVTRDVTATEQVNCFPGKESLLEEGRQQFFEKAKLYFQCVSRVEDVLHMDFFFRNQTCYYIRQKK